MAGKNHFEGNKSENRAHLKTYAVLLSRCLSVSRIYNASHSALSYF
jgi:hypothetical protein